MQSIAFWDTHASPLFDALRTACSGATLQSLALSDQVSERAVSIEQETVFWNDVELTGVDVVLVARPLFPWPQPHATATGCRAPTEVADRDSLLSWAAAEREDRALLLSALRVVADRCPVVNHPDAAHLTASPAVALERLSQAGLPTLSWRLQPAPDTAEGAAHGIDVLICDAVGRDLWRTPRTPPAGDPALVLAADEGVFHDGASLTTLLVVGGRIAGARVHPTAAAWCADNVGAAAATGTGSARVCTDVPEAQAGLALSAARALGLDVAAVSLLGGSVLWIEPAADLTAWNTWLDGALTAVLAQHLLALARGDVLPASAALATGAQSATPAPATRADGGPPAEPPTTAGSVPA